MTHSWVAGLVVRAVSPRARRSFAEVQDDVREELVWDLGALAAADLLTDERAARGGVGGSVAGLPSLHLNLGECSRKLGEVDRAREH